MRQNWRLLRHIFKDAYIFDAGGWSFKFVSRINIMTLSQSDYVEVGIGCLYAPPFLGRFLLYRLFGCNQAILIYHRKTSNCESTFNYGGAMGLTAIYFPPAVIYVHFCSGSASVSLEDLLRLPPEEMPVPGNEATRAVFGNLTVRLEEYDLSLTEKMIMAFEQEPQQVIRIENSDYQIAGPVRVAYWPNTVQTGALKLRCIKVSIGIGNWTSGADCKIELVDNWKLTALDMEEAGQPPIEVNLERGNPIKLTGR